MYLFLDTEFTDFKDCDLISLGIVSEDGQHEFYVEITDYEKSWASPFVREVVLPMLDNEKYGKSFADASVALDDWLQALPSDNVNVIIDYGMDQQLFLELLIARPAQNKKKINVRMIDPAFRNCLAERGFHSMSQQKVAWDNLIVKSERYFIEHDNRVHHSLVDAKANRHGWVEAMKAAREI